jgi:hypothetical protein
MIFPVSSRSSTTEVGSYNASETNEQRLPGNGVKCSGPAARKCEKLRPSAYSMRDRPSYTSHTSYKYSNRVLLGKITDPYDGCCCVAGMSLVRVKSQMLASDVLGTLRLDFADAATRPSAPPSPLSPLSSSPPTYAVFRPCCSQSMQLDPSPTTS